ncbi:hypothetical protein ERJ75_000086200 [Trypanosoma vivax]|uniref:Uncharacterized protein n=1 Tax=Trypanosoma vivax (strain Y486) TaxID=1055687 RepID=F9WUD3_TRYVY|nr:hypothetical protein ERJ75_000086200 [Trypanosoma vivax]CCD21182.1 hypothetical protein, conserved in T.vivax [Trypanosoma vivax Y486]CCD21876.1 unnamed protein product [Trypanosoma vivax Y486]|eukprot:CCD21182.1 hypothetical protein, conserved in T.vivax [Trypanosoma vivax Y486]
MFKPFFLCAAAWCALCFATAHGQVAEDKDKDIHQQIAIDCEEANGHKINVSLAKSVGRYNFSCFKYGPDTSIGLSVEGSNTSKKLSGLGGSRAWCTYDGEVNDDNFTCGQKVPRSMFKFPRESCTVWEQEDAVPWFSTFVVDGKNVTCSVSGIYGDLIYSFKTEKAPDASKGHKNITLHVTVFASKGFLPPDPKPLSSHTQGLAHAVQTQNSHSSPKSKKESGPDVSNADLGSARHEAPSKPPRPTKQAVSAKPANTPGGIQNEKPGGSSWGVAQPGEWDKSAQAGSSGQKATVAEASCGHANAAVTLSLPMLLVRPFAG